MGMVLKNPFFTEESILPENFDITKLDAIMKNLGYFKKNALVIELTKPKTEIKASNENVLEFFTSPSNKKYTVTKETDFLISGQAPEGVTEVYVNDYQLKAFSPKERRFYYRASLGLGTLKNGINTYILSFTTGGKKVTKETLTLFLATTQEEADSKEKEFAEKLQKEKNLLLSQAEKNEGE
jgi:hypothetical protein